MSAGPITLMDQLADRQHQNGHLDRSTIMIILQKLK